MNMGNLTIINGETPAEEYERELDRILDLIELQEKWKAYYNKLILKCDDIVGGKREISQEELRKLCFAGVKSLALKCEIKYSLKALKELKDAEESIKKDFWEANVLMTLISGLTPRNLMIAFPITKRFDGEKWGWKDYFFTIDEINKLDMDSEIGKDKMEGLLFDYQNILLEKLLIELKTCIDDYKRLHIDAKAKTKSKRSGNLTIIK